MPMDDSDYESDNVGEESYDHTSDGKRTGASGYRLTNVLKLPRATTYSTQALYDQIHAGDIDLEPEYQRDVVWPESKQIGLIDSILRNFYVPPLIFVVHQYEDGSETKTCIDGKQRLTSIQRFMDGLISHRDPVTHAKYWYKASGATESRRGELLPERYRRLFANKQIVCIEYQDLPDSDEREIFQRVQLGMALTPAEKLQVLNTPMSAFVRKLQSEYLYAGSPLDTENFDWDRSRGGDFRCIAQALYVIAKYPWSLSLGSILQLERWLHNPVVKPSVGGKGKKKVGEDSGNQDLSKDEAFLERAHATFRTLLKLVVNETRQPLFLKPEWRVSPIEFVMICLLVSVGKDSLGLEELATRVGEMRVRVRAEHRDIRMNSRVAETMFNFIKESAGSSEGGLKRKREEEDTSGPAWKGRDEDGVGRAPSVTSSMPAPPRPDQTKRAIAPPRVTVPLTPATLR